MKLELKTPFGEITTTVSDGFIGNAEITPEGVVSIMLYPESPPDQMGEQEQPVFLGDE